ncbi:hypothetical protein C8A01DRAFT_15727 [Parachaetomium inaequale]|uniref:ATP-grasp domain-containing protein n=1 Tax=Parachaetomium inaequale TaxID=2588326 RepID=A0AAN6PJP1_9PEZI|nr:hypothetical protein C8A01DRAFT_15727 [Parachaetomium inaequale]
MGSVEDRTPAGVKLPTIKLDTTLAELYRQACPENAGIRLGWVSCGITSGVNLTPDFPRNTKFVYEDQVLIKAPSHDLNSGNTSLRRSLAKKYLSHISQRDAFISGNTPVILFNLGRTPKEAEHDRRDAEATISVLDPSQRPELIFCPGPSNIPMEEHGLDKLQYKVILDGLEKYPLTHDLETHWFLNSKAALARSGLPTPASDLIETQGYPPPAETCCPLCAVLATDTSRLPSIPARCTGPRGAWLAAQTSRILAAVRARPVPFVLKTQQAFGGAGTWLVTTQAQKTQLLADLAGTTPKSGEGKGKEDGGLLAKLLPLVTKENAHLSPTTLLLTDLIPQSKPASSTGGESEDGDGGGDYGLTFIVASSERAHFLAAAEQMLTSDGSSAWIGSTIHYDRQEKLRARFAGLMGKVAEWVARHGYAGPVGVDVLTSGESSSSSEEGSTGDSGDGDGGGGCFIVDLNVRTCGSVSLPLLRGHFTTRGLWCASSFSIGVQGGRREFIEKWRGEFEEGRMLILSWYEDPREGGSIADVVVGGEDEGRLKELMGRVRESTEEVTF